MPRVLAVQRIDEIAALAAAATAAQGDLVARTRVGRDRTGGETVPGSRIDDALDNPDSAAAAGAAAVGALRRAVDELPPEGRRELLAVMFIGRGDFAAAEWPQAVDQAARLPEDQLTRTATDEIQLHDYLKKGLYTLDQA